MSDESNTEQLMSQSQKDKLLRDIHHVLVGDPFDASRPGLVSIVGRHDETLYGKNGNNGLRGDANKMKKLVWAGGGFVCALNVGIVLYEAYKTGH